MKELIRTDILAVHLLKLNTEGLEDERGAPYLLLEWPGDSARLEREKESLNALRDELDRVCLGEDTDRIREARRILPQVAPGDLRPGSGLLLSGPHDDLGPVPAGVGEEPRVLKLLADYAWVSILLFQNGISHRERHVADLLLGRNTGLVLNWADMDRSGTGFVSHFQDLRRLLVDCVGANKGSRGLRRVLDLLDWTEAAGMGTEIAGEAMSDVACILENLEAAWTTDPGKLLASAEGQWKDRRKRQLAADTLSVYRLRWPDDPAAEGLCSRSEQAQLETELERMLDKAREQVASGRLDLAIQCLRWAAAKAPVSPDLQGLEIFQWLASTAVVLEVQESKGEVLALVQALKGTTGERNVERLFRRYRELVAKPGLPGDDLGHPHCVLWQLAAMTNFQQATAFGQGTGSARQFYRLLVRARRAYQALPPPWRAELNSLWAKEPGPIFDEVERRRRITLREARWWRGLPREEPDKLAQDLRALEEAAEHPREVPIASWFPRDSEVEEIPFDLMGRLLALRRGGDGKVVSSHGIAYREFVDLHEKRSRRVKRFLQGQGNVPDLRPTPKDPPPSLPTAATPMPTPISQRDGRWSRDLAAFFLGVAATLVAIFLPDRPPQVPAPGASNQVTGPKQGPAVAHHPRLQAGTVYGLIGDTRQPGTQILKLDVRLEADDFEAKPEDCDDKYCRITVYAYVAEDTVEPAKGRLRRLIPRSEMYEYSGSGRQIGELSLQAAGLPVHIIEEASSWTRDRVPYRRVAIAALVPKAHIRFEYCRRTNL